jgi:hypothetical protein
MIYKTLTNCHREDIRARYVAQKGVEAMALALETSRRFARRVSDTNDT